MRTQRVWLKRARLSPGGRWLWARLALKPAQAAGAAGGRSCALALGSCRLSAQPGAALRGSGGGTAPGRPRLLSGEQRFLDFPEIAYLLSLSEGRSLL